MKFEKIIEPNLKIQNLQKILVNELSQLLPNSHIELIGAMAVPMVGRPEVDVMIISKNIAEDSDILVKNGYERGPVIDETLFLKKMKDYIEIGVQIMFPKNNMIDIHRNIIKKLHEDNELKIRYEIFKRTLSGLTREEYKKQKSAWIKENIIPLLLEKK